MAVYRALSNADKWLVAIQQNGKWKLKLHVGACRLIIVTREYRTCSIMCPPQINALPPLWGLSYCAGFLSRKPRPPALTRPIYVCAY